MGLAELPGGLAQGLPPSWIWPMAGVWLSLVGGYIGFAGFLQARRFLRWVGNRVGLLRGLRRLALAPLEKAPSMLNDGATVRVRGVVESVFPFCSRHARKPAVLARWFVLGHHGEPLDHAYAWRPFSLRLESGESVDVSAGDDPGRIVFAGGHRFEWWISAMGAWRGGEIRETLVAPGDRIEVLGTLRLTVDPDGLRSDPRAAPMRRVLVPGTDFPLVLSAPHRLVRAAESGSLSADLAARRAALPAVDAG